MPTDTGQATYLEAVGLALDHEMDRDPDVFLIGEDVGQYGGAFKVTKGFLDKFGPLRVVDTPIAETGFTGLAAGAALVGLRPVVEYQFADFISCAFDPIVNVLAKHYYRTGDPMPVTMRAPFGGRLRAGLAGVRRRPVRFGNDAVGQFHPVRASVVHGAEDLGGVQQGLGRDAAPVQAGAADLLLLHQGHREAGGRGVERRGVATGAAAKYDDVVVGHDPGPLDSWARVTVAQRIRLWPPSGWCPRSPPAAGSQRPPAADWSGSGCSSRRSA